MLTGRKDTDILILDSLEDRDVLNYCLTNKMGSTICSDESFWRNRFFRKISPTREALKFKPEGMTWKKYYLKTVIDIEKLEPLILKFNDNHNYSKPALYVLNQIVENLKLRFYDLRNVRRLKKQIRKEFEFNPRLAQGVDMEASKSLRRWLNDYQEPWLLPLILVDNLPDDGEIMLAGIIEYFLGEILEPISKENIDGQEILDILRKDSDFKQVFDF